MKWSKRLQLWKGGKLNTREVFQLMNDKGDLKRCATSECPKILLDDENAPDDLVLGRLSLAFQEAKTPDDCIAIEKQIRAREKELVKKERK